MAKRLSENLTSLYLGAGAEVETQNGTAENRGVCGKLRRCVLLADRIG